MVARYGREFGWEDDRLWWSNDGEILEVSQKAPKLPPISLAAAMQTAAMLDWPVIPAKLSSIELLGRQTLLHVGGKSILLDVAHNPHAVGRLKERINEWRLMRPSADVLAVLGIYQDKAADEMLGLLTGVVNSFYCSEVAEPRALSKDRLVEVLVNQGETAKAFMSIDVAVKEALERSEQDDLVVVFGSFPVVGEALNYFHHHSFGIGQNSGNRA